MTELQALQKLSAAHCVLLAVHYAIESNISALRALTALREADFEYELILQVLLTHLPETADPSLLAQYLHELATNSRSPGDHPTTSLDLSSVQDLSNSQARKKRRKIELLQLAHASYANDTELDPLTQFLIHRAHLIDADTGLLDLVPDLVNPFLAHSKPLRTWFISTVLPLLRLGYEYYPQKQTPSLETFTQLRGRRAVECQLSYLRQTNGGKVDADYAARDLRGVVGPWMCGANERKRRKLSVNDRRASISQERTLDTSEPDDWECLFEWVAHTAKEDFPLVSAAIAGWDGPEDLDLGGYDEGHIYIQEDRQRSLELRYAQTALASIYIVENSSTETLQAAHSLLIRLTNLLSLDPPQALNIAVELLPSYDLKAPLLEESTTTILQSDHILRPDNVITQPSRNTIRVVELFLYSASVLSSLQYPISVRDVARLYLRDERTEQLSLLQKILHALSSGPKKDGESWKVIRSKLLWLWNWGTGSPGDEHYGEGIFGRLDEKTIETEILKALLESNHYALAIQIYITTPSSQPPLSKPDVQKVVLEAALHDYDNASNGNRTRGGMKKASDIIATFSPHFPSSTRFQRMRALLAATHAMSFYSLILQHGVPFQPVNIRVSADPLSLLRILMSQNSRSYTHLDDLVSIGQNLVISMPSTLMSDENDSVHMEPAEVLKKKLAAERRVTGMAIEAALEEDDFETAYSYVVNRLSAPNVSPAVSPAASNSLNRLSFDSVDFTKQSDEAEDVSWRAALLAGRYRSSPSTSWSGSASRSDLRRLEQRMELLSQALLLAPPSHLEEVLAVWQECEREMTALLAEETEAEERFNDLADQKLPGAFANETVAVQPRREVGRGAVEESPMGLFDVARGAAAAFSKSAFPLRGNASASVPAARDVDLASSRTSMDLSDNGSASGADDRVRRRDMVASAVTGGLASGLGWVLGMSLPLYGSHGAND
jgi:hypothetical protein